MSPQVLLLGILLTLSAPLFAESCMSMSGPFDCGQLEKTLKELGHYSPGSPRACKILLNFDVGHEADRCLKIKNQDACTALSGNCVWDRHRSRCDGIFIHECEEKANSSMARCQSIDWYAQQDWPCLKKETANCYVCRASIGGALQRYFSKKTVPPH